MKVHPIFTEENDCQDCYKCVRECPVKAIQIENHSASIITERCIYCGHCTMVCPANAKKVREDIKTVEYFIEKKYTLIASLAPSYYSEFAEWEQGQLINALKKLGFNYVSETALGAEMVSKGVSEWLKSQENGTYISSCCPTVVDLIHQYYPQHKKLITPITTPMLAHGSFLKEKLDKSSKVVFIGPCIAKKKEAEKNPGSIDAVITFKKLREWFQQKGITPSNTSTKIDAGFFPEISNIGSIYPIDGGMLTTLNKEISITSSNYMCFSGLDVIMDLLDNISGEKSNSQLFLELMACKGGCINGPVASCDKNTATKRLSIISNFNNQKEYKHENLNLDRGNIENKFDYLNPIINPTYSSTEISKSLQLIGKYSEKDELNCSGCGYENCKDFATAMLNKIADPSMCVSHMRQTAQTKASLLMQKMPYAVVIVDEKLTILESNKTFASLLGEDIEMAFEHTPGLTGYELKKLLPTHKHFSNLIKSGAELVEKDLKLNNRNVHLSLFTIQKHQKVCGIIHSFNTPEIIKAEIGRRSKQVIRQNLKTVQKIALLLGENASQTEALLNSLVNIDDNAE